MAIPGLSIIAESINDSVPSTKKLFEANDMEGIKALAKKQDEGGAAFIDVNVGRRSAEFMAETVRLVQGVTAKPLSIDSPDGALVKAGLEAYDLDRAGGRMPILNSISVMRPQMFDLYSVRPFMPILLATERMDERGDCVPCKTAAETLDAARHMVRLGKKKIPALKNSQVIIDGGIAPIGSDTEGMTCRLLEAIRLIHADPELAGVHMSVGLSNFTVMLPSKRGNGEPVKGPLESAFLTKAMPLGLDMVIGSTARNYKTLSAGDAAFACLEDFLKLEGFDAIIRVQEFYS